MNRYKHIVSLDRALSGERGFLLVLTAAILTFVASPALSGSDVGLVLLNTLFLALMLAALVASGIRGIPFRVALLLAAFASLVVALNRLTNVSVFLAPRALISTGFWIVVPVLVLRRVLRERHVTLNSVYGALSAYFLIGLLLGFLYETIEEIDEGSFSFPQPFQEEHTDEFLYFSLVTQTTLGFGDVTPIKSIPRTITAVQAVVGQAYLVVLVARLVALQLINEERARKQDDSTRSQRLPWRAGRTQDGEENDDT